jgi:hypothetical protein
MPASVQTIDKPPSGRIVDVGTQVTVKKSSGEMVQQTVTSSKLSAVAMQNVRSVFVYCPL